MKIPNIFRAFTSLRLHRSRISDCTIFNYQRQFLTTMQTENKEMKDFLEYLNKLKNYEKSGVPVGAGTDSDDGFDLGRMRRLLHRLGNPQSKFKAVHIAGTKGKGSTAAFLSGILRAEGYSVGCYSSPHIRTIRERITLGTKGEPVSAKALQSHFNTIKDELDIAVKIERGHLSHFEVLTAIAFSLFAEEKVQFAVIEAGLGGTRDATNVIDSSDLATSIITNVGEEHLSALGGSLESIAEAKSGIIKDGRPVVLGGPFLPHIERIIRDKASTLHSLVVSATDIGNTSVLKGFSKPCQIPRQLCDIHLRIEDMNLFIELFDLQLRLIGSHQLQNATTAACAALCLRHQGWKISDTSIRAGLESTVLLGRSQFLTSKEADTLGLPGAIVLLDGDIRTVLLGRSQFLTSKEADTLGLPGAIVLLDGAHTKESAQALVDMITMSFPESRLILVVSMASDKDHLGFARVLLSVGSYLEAVCFIEVDIAGDRSRTTSSSLLKESWIKASKEKSIEFLDCENVEKDLTRNRFYQSTKKIGCHPILFMEGSLTTMRIANEILKSKPGNQDIITVFTGSLHIVSAVLDSLQ